MVYLTRIERFNAAHKLWVEEWSKEKNLQVFGKCANPNWHGHNYELHVTIKGVPDPVLGYTIDARDLSKIIKKEVIELLDHRNLNLDVPYFSKNLNPTAENLVMIIWKLLENKLPDQTLYALKLFETEKIYVEYFGE